MKNFNPSQPSLSSKGRSLKERNQAFTLVELIVVITILAILGTIAFMSFQGYSSDSRDSVRISDLKNIEVGLELYKTKVGKYPTADNAVEITASGTVFSYQGVAGESLLSKLRISNGGKDPVDQTYYTYMTTSNLYQYELMGFLENGNKVGFTSPQPSPLRGEGVASIFSQANAASYINRFPIIFGNELGILLDSTTNEPIQSTGTGVDILNTTTNYKAYFNTTKSVTGTGGALFTEYYNFNRVIFNNKILSKFNKNLVGYWDMETLINIGGFDYIKDLSGNGNDGECKVNWNIVSCLGNTGPKMGIGILGNGLSFNGVGDSFLVESLSGSNFPTNGTLSFYMKANFEGQITKGVFDDYKGSRNHIFFRSYFYQNDTNNTQIAFQNNGGNSSPYNFSLNNNLLRNFYTKVKYNFTQITISWDTINNIGAFYVNGNLLQKGIINNNNGHWTPNEQLFSFFSNFKGELDEIRLYKKVLTDKEISASYDNRFK